MADPRTYMHTPDCAWALHWNPPHPIPLRPIPLTEGGLDAEAPACTCAPTTELEAFANPRPCHRPGCGGVIESTECCSECGLAHCGPPCEHCGAVAWHLVSCPEYICGLDTQPSVGVPTPPTADTPLTVGFILFVHAFGTWYPGVVARLTPTRVHVKYVTGAGHTHTKICKQVGDTLLSLNRPTKKRGQGRRRRHFARYSR